MSNKEKLPGIERLDVVEAQVVHQKDMADSQRRAEVALLEGVEALVNGYSFYDDQEIRRKPSQEVSAYVDRINLELERQNNPFSAFHEQEKGKLSKKPIKRQPIISKRISTSLTRKPYVR